MLHEQKLKFISAQNYEEIVIPHYPSIKMIASLILLRSVISHNLVELKSSQSGPFSFLFY